MIITITGTNGRVIKKLPDSMYVLVLGELKRNDISYSVSKTLTKEND